MNASKTTSMGEPPLNRVQRYIYGAGWRPSDLSRHLKVKRQAIDMVIKGKTRSGMLQLRIAGLLGIDPREIWGPWLAPEAESLLTHAGHLAAPSGQAKAKAARA